MPLSQTEPLVASTSAAISPVIVAPPTSLSSGVVVSPSTAVDVVVVTTVGSSHGGETPPPTGSERKIGKILFLHVFLPRREFYGANRYLL